MMNSPMTMNDRQIVIRFLSAFIFGGNAFPVTAASGFAKPPAAISCGAPLLAGRLLFLGLLGLFFLGQVADDAGAGHPQFHVVVHLDEHLILLVADRDNGAV